MKREGWIGAISGAIAGGVGALLVILYDWSLFVVAGVGAVIGLLVNWVAQKIKKD